MPTLLERFETSQNPDYQRRVKMAALAIAGQVMTSAPPSDPGPEAAPGTTANYQAAVSRRSFAARVAGDPDSYAPRIATALAAMTDVDADSTDEEMAAAMAQLFQVYQG